MCGNDMLFHEPRVIGVTGEYPIIDRWRSVSIDLLNSELIDVRILSSSEARTGYH